MWTDEERKLAGQLYNSKEMMALLKKIYCPDRAKVRTELESIITLDDAEYGRQMKALVIAEKHFADAHATIKRIALKDKDDSDESTNVAPR